MNYLDFIDMIINMGGPVTQNIGGSHKFDPVMYRDLQEQLYKRQSVDDLTNEQKLILLDAFRICLEGIDDYDFEAVTYKNKKYFLELYIKVSKLWNINSPALKQNVFDSVEYQKYAASTGYVKKIDKIV